MLTLISGMPKFQGYFASKSYEWKRKGPALQRPPILSYITARKILIMYSTVPPNQSARPSSQFCIFIHTSVSDLYIPRIVPPILLQPNRQKLEIGAEATPILFDYFFPIFGREFL
jgi:hypothetical protein